MSLEQMMGQLAGGDPAGQTPPADGQPSEAQPQMINLTQEQFDLLTKASRDLEEAKQADLRSKMTADQRVEAAEARMAKGLVSMGVSTVAPPNGWRSEHAAQQARAMLASECDVRDVNGVPTVWHVGHNRPLSEVAASVLSSARYEHFTVGPDVTGQGRPDPSRFAGGLYDRDAGPSVDEMVGAMPLVGGLFGAGFAGPPGTTGGGYMPAQLRRAADRRQ